MGSNMNFKNFGSDPQQAADGSENKPLGNNRLTRQPSIYSLTFDEFQSTMGGIGKDFGSMNMDELLKNIWNAEETQTMASSNGAVEGNGGLQRQGSLTLPRTLSQKTVDEVWKDISKEFSIGIDGIGTVGGTNNMPQRQHTLGEMTLEEFLVRAGVVREDTQLVGKVNDVNGGFFGELLLSGNNTGFGIGFQQGGRGPNLMGNKVSEGGNQIGIRASDLPLNVNGVRSNQHQLTQQQTQQQHQHQQPIFPKQPVVGYGAQIPLQNGARFGSPGIRGGIAGIGDQGLNNGLIQGAALQGGGMGMVGLGGPVSVTTGSPANHLSSDGIGKSSGDTSSVSPVPYVFNGSLRGRRCSAVEKVAERRQKRMIKNRESAARSRARKQAYTMELEAEVAKLKEENQELQRKHAEIMEMQKNQVVEVMNMQQGAKKQCLRRTQTSPW
ncbi:ABSCISIC ACID-INSENSITIVE 5-like protein 5 [Durio zibethinus]|uniref:ABSCISIC ACID-INSENSITIVE 5-like protein 5 n=1 Tax=Durio zibethinus TaxID=66656 RepID=A0A6P6AVB2_DURZI|nr:ABSCISIC ACID-INSENSITIVE 5-like protein 5 [Durio zibethinus]XP_022768758.1 ABSCISIC ACID-INSENSITIVE 5-like protein 5 [Durio zibethinus]